MRRVSQLFSLVLLAVWLPATQCCALEAAGLVKTFCCDDDCTAAHACANGSCANFESGLYKSTSLSVNVSAPALREYTLLVTTLFVPSLSEPTDILPPVSHERAVDWVAAWHFVRRTAPPSRAPAHFFA